MAQHVRGGERRAQQAHRAQRAALGHGRQRSVERVGVGQARQAGRVQPRGQLPMLRCQQVLLVVRQLGVVVVLLLVGAVMSRRCRSSSGGRGGRHVRRHRVVPRHGGGGRRRRLVRLLHLRVPLLALLHAGVGVGVRRLQGGSWPEGRRVAEQGAGCQGGCHARGCRGCAPPVIKPASP